MSIGKNFVSGGFLFRINIDKIYKECYDLLYLINYTESKKNERRKKTNKFEIEKEQAGYYNMGEGFVAITDSENSEKSARITQYNCELSDMQIIKIYGFLQKHPELESPTAGPKESQGAIYLERNALLFRQILSAAARI